MRGIKIITAAWLIVLFLASSFHFALADIFDLSYTLTEGGYQLQLSPDNSSKGVKIEINSDVAVRYEVVQRIITPLQSRDNPGQAIRDNFVVRGLRGSNRYGDLRVSAGETPVVSDEVLYVSNPSGNADSFTLVYGLRNLQDIEAGDYLGRISFTLNPIGAARQQITRILEVHLIISKAAGTKPQIEISTASGSKQITLNPARGAARTADLAVKINGSFKRAFSIKQFLPSPPESEEGNRLNFEAVNFIVRNAGSGMAVNRFTPLSAGMQEVYISDPDGRADSEFVITYGLADISAARAGKYRSKINYLLDESGAQSRIDTLDLVIENERVFDLVITPQGQKYTIEFSNLKPTEPPKRSEVLIEVKTNTAKPYQVTQEMRSDLTNREGKVISPKYFTMRAEGLDNKGTVKISDRQEAKKGTAVLFISDEQGSPARFKVTYELVCPQDALAGDYGANVSYSLLER